MKRTLLLAAVLVAGLASPGWAVTYFSDNFATYANGNLIGPPNAAGGWLQTQSQSTLPLQVVSGEVVIPGGQTGNNQDAVKSFGSVILPPGSGSTSVYVGLDLTVNSAPVIGGSVTSSSYFVALDNATDGSGFDNERVAAIDNSANVPGTYLLQARVTGQAGSPFVTGTIPLNYGQEYNIVIEATLTSVGTDEVINLYVNPTNGNQLMQTLYLSSPIAGGTPLTGLGALVVSQFQSASTGISAVDIGGARAASTFAEASGLAVPEPSSCALAALAAGSLALVRLRRRK